MTEPIKTIQDWIALVQNLETTFQDPEYWPFPIPEPEPSSDSEQDKEDEQ